MQKAILRQVRTEQAKLIRRKYGDKSGHCKFGNLKFSPRTDGLSNTISTVQKDNLLIMNSSKKELLDAVKGLAPDEELRIRKLTVKEVGRLMDVSDDNIDKMAQAVSKSQLYKQFGNSIVVSCLVGIFNQMFYPVDVKKKANYQMTIFDMM